MGVSKDISRFKTQNRLASAAILGTFTPRRCGIATFTSDLANSLGAVDQHLRIDAIAMSDQSYAYPDQVTADIAVNDPLAYSLAAQLLNRKGYDVLSVQHEYGIFGGTEGKYVLNLIEEAIMPVVTTLHTVLRRPTADQWSVMERLLQLSARVVVMSHTAIELLSQVHHLDRAKVDYIPHGIPRIPEHAGAELRAEIGGKGPVLLTFGLLSPDKGIENVIHAMPKLIGKHPEAKYIVVGATHPHVQAFSGEAYRQSLVKLVEELDLMAHVEFVDEFVSLERLIKYLSATQFYITPYLNPMQITSGTLAYSLGAGKVVISTPYEYAKEVLADERGILVPFADPEAIADAVIASCASESMQSKMGAEAAKFGAEMYWDKVGRLYLTSFDRAISDSVFTKRPEPIRVKPPIPDIKLSHLEALSDDTGILQHAEFSVPNREEGYCVDDNARALILTVLLEGDLAHEQRINLLQSRYLAFVASAFDLNSGKFRNFMNFKRDWLEDSGSEDSQGRSLWALGVAAGQSRVKGHALLAAKVFDRALQSIKFSTSPRTWAYTILGCRTYLDRWPESAPASRMMRSLANQLLDCFALKPIPGWPWPECKMAYANARIPQALMVAGEFMKNSEMVAQGTDTLNWLMERQITVRGMFSPVGSQGANFDDFGALQFDQQPIEAWSSVSACVSAYRITSQNRFLDYANACFDWFMGGNVHAVQMANTRTGSCYDGLMELGVNQNQGAESTLSYLCALAELKTISLEKSLVTSKWDLN